MSAREGTPWISVEVERAGPRDRPFGWTVTVRTPGRLSFRPCLDFAAVQRVAAHELGLAARTPVLVSMAQAEPLPPARRDEA